MIAVPAIAQLVIRWAWPFLLAGVTFVYGCSEGEERAARVHAVELARAAQAELEHRDELQSRANRASSLAQAKADRLRQELETARRKLRDLPLPDCELPDDLRLLHDAARGGAS